MNKPLTLTLLIFISIIINILQSTLLSPDYGSNFYPDLNLIFIIFIATSKNLPAGSFLTIFNGFLMDVMSGYTIGLHTISRLGLYLIIKSSSSHVDYENYTPKFLALFLGTIFVWLFIWLIVEIKFSVEFNITLDVLIHQATLNSLIGIVIELLIFNTYARVQK